MSPQQTLADLSSDDVATMVNKFYASVIQDDLLGPVFDSIISPDWNHHLDKMTSFWLRNLFGVSGYAGNALQAHREVDRRVGMKPEMFDRWLRLFDDTIDDRWSGPMASRAKAQAHAMGRVQQRYLFERRTRPEDAEPTTNECQERMEQS